MSPMGDMFDGRPLEPISASEEFENKKRAYKKRRSLSEASLREAATARTDTRSTRAMPAPSCSSGLALKCY